MNRSPEGICITHYIYKEGQELKMGCLESTDGRRKEESEPTKEKIVLHYMRKGNCQKGKHAT